MATLSRPSVRRTASSTIASLVSTAAKMMGAARRMRATRRIIAQLGCLEDRTLKDLGLHRSEINSLAFGFDLDPSRRYR